MFQNFSKLFCDPWPYPSSFRGLSKQNILKATFPKWNSKDGIHCAMIDDINCHDFNCKKLDCPQKLKKFYYRNESLIRMTNKNRIGAGGEGQVFKALFHGKMMAMKCVFAGKIKMNASVIDTVSVKYNISD